MPAKSGVGISSYFNNSQAGWLLALNIISILCSFLVIFILIAFWKRIILLYTVSKPALRNPTIVSTELDLWQTYNAHCSSRFKWITLLLLFNPGNSRKQNPVILSFYFITSIIDFFHSVLRLIYYTNFGMVGIKFISALTYSASLHSVFLFSLSLLSVFLRVLPALQLTLIIALKTNHMTRYLRYATSFFIAAAIALSILWKYLSLLPSSSVRNVGCINYCGYLYNLFVSNPQIPTISSAMLAATQTLKKTKTIIFFVPIAASILVSVIFTFILAGYMTKNRERLLNVRKTDPIMIISQEYPSKIRLFFSAIIRRALIFPIMVILQYILLFIWVMKSNNQAVDFNTSSDPNSSSNTTKTNSLNSTYLPSSLTTSPENYQVLPNDLYFFANLALCIPGIHLLFALLLEKPFRHSIIGYLKKKTNKYFLRSGSRNTFVPQPPQPFQDSLANTFEADFVLPASSPRSALNSSNRTFIGSMSNLDLHTSCETAFVGKPDRAEPNVSISIEVST